VREPFKAGFHYFFGVNFLPSEGNMAEKGFHKACVTMFDEGIIGDFGNSIVISLSYSATDSLEGRNLI